MPRYIDADALMKLLESLISAREKWITNNAPYEISGIYAAVCAIEDSPTADVAEVKRGKWEVVDEAEPRRYGCSRCKRLSWTADNYCSYCGAKMEMEQ